MHRPNVTRITTESPLYFPYRICLIKVRYQKAPYLVISFLKYKASYNALLMRHKG